MLLQAPRRLPGIRFEAESPPLAEVLPRMDVAAFVGFAASGPVNLPVPVTDVKQFSMIFGEEPPLFVDSGSGEAVAAYLAPALASFFANGGLRCWVVRVVRGSLNGGRWHPAAVINRFPVPGLAQRATAGRLEQATLQARSEGSWADGLSVSASLSRTPVEILPDSLQILEAGRAIQLELTASSAGVVGPGDMLQIRFGDRLSVLAPVVRAKEKDPKVPVQPGALISVPSENPVWLADRMVAAATIGTASYWGGAATRTVGLTVVGPHVPKPGSAGESLIELRLEVSAALAPVTGSSIAIELANGNAGVVRVDEVRIERESVAITSPPSSGPAQWILIQGSVFWPDSEVPVSLPLGPATRVDRLNFGLWVRKGEKLVRVFDDLGFHPLHPRFVGGLPTDAELFDPSIEAPDPWKSMWAESANPRFALAGPAPGERTQCFFPIGMDCVAEHYLAALEDEKPALVRDGLDRFDPYLFLDRTLSEMGTADLMAAADFLRYESHAPRCLTGIHALLGIDEATIVAVPDAVQLGWSAAGGDVAAVAPSSEAPRPEPSWGEFLDCGTSVIPPPVLENTEADPLGTFTPRWAPVEDTGAVYVLQETVDELGWGAADDIYRGSQPFYAVHGRAPGVYFYRVRAEIPGNSSGWSNALTVQVGASGRWVQRAAAEYSPEPLLTVQAGLLRMCAARGDLFVVLSLPRHYHQEESLAHAATLKRSKRLASAPPLSLLGLPTDDRVLSFGAVYHPWTVTSDPGQPGAARAIPPDGAAAGVLAKRAWARGAWVAPANEPLQGVVSLDPPLAPAALQPFEEGRLNLLRQEPRGFVCLSAATLGEEVQGIGTRRLLSLLRRTALLYGPTFVFEPDDPSLHRRIRRAFEGLLGRMFSLGAFAGNTPEQAFRVDVYSPKAAGAGQLIVELRVAPSHPLRFLVVRLVQSGDRGLKVEGA